MKINEDKKTERLEVRLNEKQKEQCNDIALKWSYDNGVNWTTSDIVRVAIARLHKEIFDK